MYIHQQNNWPNLTWTSAALADSLAEARHLQGKLAGRMMSLGFTLQNEASFRMLTQDVMKTSEIEGERLDVEQVRSSLARHLGIEAGGLPKASRHVEGVVEMLLDATRRYDEPLTRERLFGWHASLFPTGRSGLYRITVGDWRGEASGPMQVVSGAAGRETIHYEAPGHERIPGEMEQFIAWFNADSDMDRVMRAALAHFWFVTVHPFEDGNGRIARALADMELARSEKSMLRFYSMSAQIQREREAYYEILERSQKGGLDITPWMQWFLGCFKRAIEASGEVLEAVLVKAHFWQAHEGETFNDRQRLLLGKLLDDFKGNLTSSKWAKIAKCSQDTASRDIADLLQRKVLTKQDAGGRSTHYTLAGTSKANPQN